MVNAPSGVPDAFVGIVKSPLRALDNAERGKQNKPQAGA